MEKGDCAVIGVLGRVEKVTAFIALVMDIVTADIVAFLRGYKDCDDCDGTGVVECNNCNGYGKLRCSECEGEGKVKKECPECEGSGRKFF